MPYFNMDVAGEVNQLLRTSGPFSTDYFEALNMLGNKMLNHSHTHMEYGQFIMQGGLRLDSDMIQSMSKEELSHLLKTNKQLVVVYLADNPKSLGGFELRRLTAYTPEILEDATKLKATIVPFNIYSQAANAINKYTYGNYASAIWHKVITMYKQGWLVNVGTMLRNAIDSTMKTFIEGDSVAGTLKSYTEAFDLLNKYDSVLRDIRKLDPLGKYRLDLAEEYFSTLNKTLIDKETFDFIYDFMERSGMNTISSTVDGLFGVAMKPMGWIERVSRFAMYLNLENQGEAYSEIIRRITQTHFDYGLKSYAQFLAESYIPFVTFTTNNILYLVHLVEENPSFLRYFFDFYTPIWDFDGMNYNELAQNVSLQYQILNGNIPLSLFGYKDKEITRTIQTKYGPREQTVTNTAVLRMGSSILDAIGFFVSPYHHIKEKLAPPIQMIADSVTEFGASALGNSSRFNWLGYSETEDKYLRSMGSSSVQSLFRDPQNILDMIPFVNAVYQRYTHNENGETKWGTSTKYRTDNNMLGLLSTVFGATSRWGEFTNNHPTYEYPFTNRSSGRSRSYTPSRFSKKGFPRQVYPKRIYAKKSYARKTYPRKSYARKSYIPRQSYARKSYTGSLYLPGTSINMRGIYNAMGSSRYSTYYRGKLPKTYTSGKRPSSKYNIFMYNIQHPNYYHNKPSGFYNTNMQSIPQYLYSYMGRNRQGKSKLLSWLRMNTYMKVKSTLRRQANSFR